MNNSEPVRILAHYESFIFIVNVLKVEEDTLTRLKLREQENHHRYLRRFIQSLKAKDQRSTDVRMGLLSMSHIDAQKIARFILTNQNPYISFDLRPDWLPDWCREKIPHLFSPPIIGDHLGTRLHLQLHMIGFLRAEGHSTKKTHDEKKTLEEAVASKEYTDPQSIIIIIQSPIESESNFEIQPTDDDPKFHYFTLH